MIPQKCLRNTASQKPSSHGTRQEMGRALAQQHRPCSLLLGLPMVEAGMNEGPNTSPPLFGHINTWATIYHPLTSHAKAFNSRIASPPAENNGSKFTENVATGTPKLCPWPSSNG